MNNHNDLAEYRKQRMNLLKSAFTCDSTTTNNMHQNGIHEEMPVQTSMVSGADTTEEEEMVAAERDLAEDAQWKKIQKNTFTRWANEHLKVVSKVIGNLETDLSDGLRLIALIEVLAQKKLPKHNKRPNFRSQKLENVSVALKYLEKDEGIKIVNIDSSDIVDCKLKLILGLIWTLILHYSISMPLWEGEEDSSDKKNVPTPKQRLLNWIQGKLPELPVKNFTTDWNDGRAVGALVDACAPGLCPDWTDWKPNNSLDNAREAMGLADDWLNVPQLIAPEDIINPEVDEQSMMTYLSQFPNAKLKSGAPLRPKSNPNKVRAYGPGIEPKGNVVGAPANFTVETFSAGKGSVEVIVTNPQGQKEPAEVKCNNDRNHTYSCSYTPTCEGQYTVEVRFNNQFIPKSPFKVLVEGHAGDPTKVTVEGPGIQPEGVTVNRPTYFNVITKNAGKGNPEVIILDPQGHRNTVPVKLREVDGDMWRCEYVTPVVGVHSVNVFFAGKPIPNNPFGVNVAPLSDARRVRASGRGLQANGVRVKDEADFRVFTEGAGEGPLEIKVIGPGGTAEPIRMKAMDNGAFDCVYLPKKEGRYVVMISYGGQEIPRSPFQVNVGPYKESKIRVYGPGLEGGVVDKPACFAVETNGETGALGFSIEGPSQAKIDCKDNGDGTADITYFPTAPGEYAIHILCNNEDIPKSPYIAEIVPKNDIDSNKVKCYGPGLEKTGVVANKITEFTVDTKGAGKANLDVIITDATYRKVPVNIVESSPGIYTCSYTPTKGTKHVIQVNYGKCAAKDSPFRIEVKDPSSVNKVRVFGPGVESGVKSNVPTYFNIDASDAGPGQMGVSIGDDRGPTVAAKVSDNGDGTYTVDYTPPKAGPLSVNVTYDGKSVPQCPIHLNVKPNVDVSQVKVEGIEPSVFVKSPAELVVDATAISRTGDGRVTCSILNPSGAKLDSHVTSMGDGTYRIAYTPFEEGRHTIDIHYDGVPVPGSPFVVNARSGCDPKRCRAQGPGLEKGFVDMQNTFTVETKGAGSGGLGLSIEGPSEAKMQCKDNRNGSCTVDYFPTEAGDYDIAIKFAEEHIPGSPFKVSVDHTVNASQVKAFGPGLEPENCRAGVPINFTVDARKSGKAPVSVDVTSDHGPVAEKPEIIENGDGTYDVTYVPSSEGSNCTVKVNYGGKEIPKSPFRMKVKPTCEPKNVRVSGPSLSGRGVPASVPAEFIIDTKDAGYGDLEVQIMGPDNHPRKVKVTDNRDGTFKASFVPDDIGKYHIIVKYGGKEVPHSPFVTEAYSTGSATTQVEEQIQETRVTSELRRQRQVKKEYRIVELNCIPLPTTGGHVIAEVKMPSGNMDKPLIEDNRDGTVSIRYDPKEEGQHELAVKYNGEHVQGSPFKFYVDSISSGYVTAYGPGLTHGICGEPCNFTLSTKDAGPGGLNMAIEGPSKAELSCHDNKDGTISVSYLPTAPGEYKIGCKFADKDIRGSPFSVKITGEGRKRNHISVASSSEVSLPGKVSETDLRSLNACIHAPSGLEEPCFIKRLPKGNLGISFTPREIGPHLVSVKKKGVDIPNSPFQIQVGDLEVGDAKKVRVSGSGLTEGKTHEHNSFIIDTRDAGYGGLSLSIEGPSKAEIECKDEDDGTLNVSYKPTEPGYYIMNLKFADHHVTGSPFTVKVSGEGSNRQTERIKRQREAVPITEVGSQCRMTFKMPGITPFDLSATVTSPGGVIEDAEIVEVEEGFYAVNFVPKELGVHTVSVRLRDVHIPGSPFQFTVGPFRDGGAHRVHAGGPGLERGEVNMPCEFNVWTREAGAGSIAISVEGPSKAGIDFKDRKDGSCYVSYTVAEPGEYRVGIKFNDQHVPDSPYKVYVTPALEEARKIEIGQFPDSCGAISNKPLAFIVQKNGAKGHLDAKVISPSGAEDDCFLALIDDETYSVRFLPKENGIHMIHVRLNGVHIPGSPFRIRVGHDEADPAVVSCSGPGLKNVKTGQKTSFLVDTCNAGAGTLAVTIDGPSKVSMDCIEVDDGYEICYTPLAPGDYYAVVKYNGYHIAGSPFKIKCTGDAVAETGDVETSSVVVQTICKQGKGGKPSGLVMPKFISDATKVTCKGMGLKKAYIGKQNQFTVNAQPAGNNILFVGVYGPKSPMEEVSIKHTGRNNYNVNYVVKDRGEHILIIKWGEDHIPGSPFRVEV